MWSKKREEKQETVKVGRTSKYKWIWAIKEVKRNARQNIQLEKKGERFLLFAVRIRKYGWAN